MNKRLLIVALMMASNSVLAQDMVALLLPENINPRWEKQDATFFKERMKEIAPDVKVAVFNANNSTSTQQKQAEQALTLGAKSVTRSPYVIHS